MSASTAEPSRTTRTAASSRAREILAIGARLFEQHGYSATTVQDIADAAGMLPGSLYHHFDSKDAIAVELLEMFDEDLALVARRSLRTNTDRFGPAEARTHLAALVRDAIEVIRRHTAAVRLRAYEAPLVSGPALQRAVRTDVPTLNQAWSEALGAALRQPGGHHTYPGLLRFAFHRVTLASGTAYSPEATADALAEQLCAVLLDGLLAEEPSSDALDSSVAAHRVERVMAQWRGDATDVTDPKERILVAARAEFARRGYEASTIRGIADGAGITMGTLYRRAESKEAILREILQRYSGQLESAVRGLLSDVGSVPDSLDALARLFIHASRRFAAEAAIVNQGWNDHEHIDSPFQDYHRQTRDRLTLLEDVLRRGLADGSVRPIGSAIEIAPHFRQVMWLPYQQHARTSERRAHDFIRHDVLAGGRPRQ